MLTIIIPNAAGQSPVTTISSLYAQTFTQFKVIIINDTDANANIARNRGFKYADTEFVLFSDNDICWQPDALENMVTFLTANPQLSYCWGSYMLGDKTYCNSYWDTAELLRHNYISTMSLVRLAHHPGFDPAIRRLQDWDVWLTMLAKGYTGQYIGKQIFTTPVRDGITNRSITYDEAFAVIQEKHKSLINKLK